MPAKILVQHGTLQNVFGAFKTKDRYANVYKCGFKVSKTRRKQAKMGKMSENSRKLTL